MMEKGCRNKNKPGKKKIKLAKKEKDWEQEEKEEERDGEKVQYNYPGTFQSWYVKPVHCAAGDDMTA